LGANAFDAEAVQRIFLAKGRPADNPLIVHIHCVDALNEIAEAVPETVLKLMRDLGPAPLTYVVKKSKSIPDTVTAGLDTVAVRIPAHPVALSLLKECNLPVAAPSANASGRPSPTDAAHVYADLRGKIPLILDGGACGVGVESTVVDFTAPVPVILRPGGFSKERLETVLKTAVLTREKADGGAARSPGMKYKHYSPRCSIIVADGGNGVETTVNSFKKAYDNQVQRKAKPAIMYLEKFAPYFENYAFISLGNTAGDAAEAFFRLLRENEDKYDAIICCRLTEAGLGRAFNDRLIRAANNNDE